MFYENLCKFGAFPQVYGRHNIYEGNPAFTFFIRNDFTGSLCKHRWQEIAWRVVALRNLTFGAFPLNCRASQKYFPCSLFSRIDNTIY